MLELKASELIALLKLHCDTVPHQAQADRILEIAQALKVRTETKGAF